MSPISTAYPARCRRVDGHPGYEFRDFPATGQGDGIVSEPQQRHRHLPGHHITTRGAGHGAAAGPGGIDEEDLDSVRRAGYATEDYERWQFGQCATYARALMQMKPGLKFGVMGVGSGEHKYPTHFFAHDNRYAYDSAGRHPLPYRGITHHADYCDLDQDPQVRQCPLMPPSRTSPQRRIMPGATASSRAVIRTRRCRSTPARPLTPKPRWRAASGAARHQTTRQPRRADSGQHNLTRLSWPRGEVLDDRPSRASRTGRNQRRRQPSLGVPDRQHRDFPATGQAIRGPGAWHR